MSENVAPPSVETCHCTVGDGLPEAEALKLNGSPAATAWSDGLDVTDGAVCTVRLAAVVVVEPTTLVKTARYWWPSSAPVAVPAKVVEVAPGMSVNVAPPS